MDDQTTPPLEIIAELKEDLYALSCKVNFDMSAQSPESVANAQTFVLAWRGLQTFLPHELKHESTEHALWCGKVLAEMQERHPNPQASVLITDLGASKRFLTFMTDSVNELKAGAANPKTSP